jgi:hypothetical protein
MLALGELESGNSRSRGDNGGGMATSKRKAVLSGDPGQRDRIRESVESGRDPLFPRAILEPGGRSPRPTSGPQPRLRTSRRRKARGHGGREVSEVSTEARVANTRLDLEQLLSIVRGLDDEARARVAQALLETDMDSRLERLVSRLADRAPAPGIGDAEIQGEVDAVRRGHR